MDQIKDNDGNVIRNQSKENNDDIALAI